MIKAARVENGHAYCRTCYSRVFKRVSCSACGGPTRAHAHDCKPVCPTCRRKDRRCSRCGKPVIKAGRIVAGRAVCASCSIYYAEPRPCANCGRLSRRLSKAPGQGFDKPVCDRCRTGGFKTCSVCRRYRKVHRYDERQRPVCSQCSAENPARHPCPDCGVAIPGTGSSRCEDCNTKDRIRRRIRLNVELLEQPWVRSLFEGFCGWQGLLKVAVNMAARIDRYAVFFATIDRNCAAPSEVTQRRLFDLFGAEGLRRGFLVVSFLCERVALEWDAKALEDMIEMGRIDRQAELWRDRGWYAGLRRYVDELQKSGPPRLRQSTIRMYQATAANFLEAARVETVGDIMQQHLERHLKRHAGQAANLSPFLRHLREVYEIDLALSKKPGTSIQSKDRALVQRVQSLTQRLHSATDGRDARALLATLLAELYQVPLKYVLAMSAEDVVVDSDVIVLWPDTREVRLDGRLAALFRRWLPIPEGANLVFQGRNGVQPLSYHTVRYQLRKHADTRLGR